MTRTLLSILCLSLALSTYADDTLKPKGPPAAQARAKGDGKAVFPGVRLAELRVVQVPGPVPRPARR